jgi:hypothetical protein
MNATRGTPKAVACARRLVALTASDINATHIRKETLTKNRSIMQACMLAALREGASRSFPSS